MAQSTVENLEESPSNYYSPRDVNDVLVGEDAAGLVIEASSSGKDAALQSLLSQPQWVKIMLDKPRCIYYQSRPSRGLNDVREVAAMRMSNLERALIAAAQNGQAAVASTLLAFATQQGVDTSEVVTRFTINKAIYGGHAAVVKVLVSADPNLLNLQIGHGTSAIYEAAKRGQTDVVAVLLELGADPLHPIKSLRKVGSYNSSLLSFAAKAKGPRMTKIMLEHGVPVAHTGALHAAAHCGHLDTMRLLMQHSADVNEVLSNWKSRTTMHFAALQSQVDAIKLLEQSGAGPDLKDADGRTPAQLLDELNTA